MKKIQGIAAEQQLQHPDAEIVCLPEMGLHPQLMAVMRRREIETQEGTVQMNCELCKFRLAVSAASGSHGHDHHGHNHGHNHGHHDQGHGHDHGHDHGAMVDPYQEPAQYHGRIWQVP